MELHTYKVGMMSSTALVRAPSAAAAAFYYGAVLVETNNPFLVACYEEDGVRWQGDAWWMAVFPSEAHLNRVIERIGDEITHCSLWKEDPPPLTPVEREVIINDGIAAEVRRQFEKWGEQRHHPERWLAILTEEVGEVAQAILQGRAADAQQELIQVAAVCVSWLKYAEDADASPV